MRALLIMLCLMGQAYAQNLYGIQEKSIEGKEFNTDSLKGKVVMIVNIASQCGYTTQLAALETLNQKYKEKGFILLGVPTNDFNGQTPESDEGMKEFCSKKYNVTFPLLNKRTVQGKEKRPLYKFLTEKTPKKFQAEIGWNFEKFLVNKKGEVVGRFRPSLAPDDKSITEMIEKNL